MTITKSILLLIAFVLISCGTKTINHSHFIDNIEHGDTLKLTADLADCGEWGGHKEHVFIYYYGNNLFFTYKIDSTYCMGKTTDQHTLINISKQMTREHKENLSSYIDSLLKFQKTHFELFSNGPNSYYLETKDTIIEAIDNNGDWSFFQTLVNRLLK